ncbi:lipopolysaccharide/colanic/teichoic acid biosynthesis glycosyltransferase [Microbacteriaceae bacterium SG_E_30_P1]|uniref:Lipopolysaccharide/colanic/teichoic acid biosynthesis glycosyltransferase n=1 Tax=Antiquaquibacter oligotrophicus TaxID=2880260 RepID=A0ABT6KJY4_9MICO|nr:sugar transferase [Antiquaquibacter oligotrophicus]MDH6180260.1 lipopolysaccharide/colanic/teichoic acid biosynthesis glycosyltransferase [Antiquaquibacter oligotrophicus]UDF13993.1 sugar transferase [Antiquaquibacter oligotrophicus]
MYSAVKRGLDFAASVLILVVLTPILLPIMLALRLTGEGEVFYKQKRVGYRNEDFGIWKFATMLKNSPNMGTGSLTVRGDPRVTPVGKYLRATKVNELPQLLNVVTGEMSFVGPRPQMQIDFDVYPQHVRETIYSVRPGITGIGSIVFRDEERLLSVPGRDPRAFYADYIAPYKGELEMWYLRRKSLVTDIRLVFHTAWAVVAPQSGAIFRAFPDLPPRPDWLE